jgi:circadian clock protein KaiC
MVEKIKSGITGFDTLISNGFVKNSITTLYGSPGAGKSIFCTEFLRQGLKDGEKVFYFSLEQDIDSFLREAESLGFSEFRTNLNTNFIFTKMSGHDFKNFLSVEMPKILESRKGKHSRIVIDPLTPFLWEVRDPAIQRNVLGEAFNMLHDFGTALVAIERYGDINKMELSEELAIPLYLSDSVIILSMIYNQNFYQKTISVIKMRFSTHSSGMHPFDITEKGIQVFQDQPVF